MAERAKDDFFSTLSDASKSYAFPAHLGREVLGKRGIHGEAHRAAWEHAQQRGVKSVHRMVSVYLGDRSEVAAIIDGRAVETSAGFSPADGLPSLNASGDLDPTILFELRAEYLDLSDLEELAARRSGIRGYLGKDISFQEFLTLNEERAAGLRDIFAYQVLKHIGAQAALLGGLDVLVFIAEDDEGSRRLIDALCDGLRFIGLDTDPCPSLGKEGTTLFSRPSSTVEVLFTKV